MTANASAPTARSMLSSPWKGFDDHGGSLTPSNAGAAESVPTPAVPQGVQEVERYAGSAGAERVAQRNGASIHVGPLPIEPQLLFHRQVLGGKGLIHFDQVHLIEREPGPGKRLPRGRCGSDAHVGGLYPYAGPGEEPSDRLETALGRKALARHHQRGGAIGNSGGVAGCHHAVLLEVRWQLGQGLERGSGTHVLVRGPVFVLLRLAVLNRHRDNFISEGLRLPG